MNKNELAEFNGYVLTESKSGYSVERADANNFGLPAIYLQSPDKFPSNNGKYAFKIDIKKIGGSDMDKVSEMLANYQKAVDAVNYFKKVMTDNQHIEFK